MQVGKEGGCDACLSKHSHTTVAKPHGAVKQGRNKLTYNEGHEHVKWHAYASETQHHRKGILEFRGTARLGLSRFRVMTAQEALN